MGIKTTSLLLFFSALSFAQVVSSNRYILLLSDEAVAAHFASPASPRSAQAVTYRQQIEAKQSILRNALAARNIRVTGASSTVLNAVFVIAAKGRLAELQSLPGVVAVVPSRYHDLQLNRATQLADAPAAWTALGGMPNAGAGIKIGMLDTGIDQAHPAFQDPNLQAPAGYPICSGSDCDFTNNKVIVARSYVKMLAAGSDPKNPAVDSRPDDYSPRDRQGHGTATASCAAGVTNTGTVTFSGIAPKAFLGNYKIAGTPGLNDGTYDDVIIQALDDAVKDGMDIISFSFGGLPLSGPLDTGAVCGNPAGVACDPSAKAFENAVQAGTVIVAAGGNDGYTGLYSYSAPSYTPSYNTTSSPGDAPSVIAVGATTNSHTFLETVSVVGAGVAANLQGLATQTGDANIPTGPFAAPLIDVTTLGDNGQACSTLPSRSLLGAFALIVRGTCTFAAKITNAENAGAIGVIFYMSAAGAPIAFTSAGDATPVVMVSQTDGLALKSYVDATPGQVVVMDPTAAEQSATGYNEVAYFSSAGPSIGTYAIKPDLVAPGTNMYVATQSFDPSVVYYYGMYGANGYSVVDGTSFATPLVSGAAAMVKQAHPNYTPLQIKSALVNTAAASVSTDNGGDLGLSPSNNPVNVLSVGAGLLDAGAAVNSTVTINPVTVSFGVLASGSLPKTQTLQITNNGQSAVTLSAAIAAASTGSGTTLTLDKQSLSLAPNATGAITATLGGAVPAAGQYSGAITLQGSGMSLRVPYLYMVGDGSLTNSDVIPLMGTTFDGSVGQGSPYGIVAFKLVDDFGVPIANSPVSFSARGGGSFAAADSATDANGIATAQPVLGALAGSYTYYVAMGGVSTPFYGTARLQPTIYSGGIENAGSFDNSKAFAPGSYILIYGSGLSDVTDSAFSNVLPLSLDYAHVTFDVPSAGISVPGHLTFVSAGQVNTQIPWELQGESSAQMKVSIDFSDGNVVTIPLSNYAPAFFGSSSLAAARDVNYNVISSTNPAVRGQVVMLYANGLGPVTNQPASGTPALASPLSQTTTPAVVMIGGQQATVQFAGLAPEYAGLYQLNVLVPSNLTPGNQTVTVSIGGQTSPASALPVQ